MRLISTLKRAKYVGSALVLLFATMPVFPVGTVKASDANPFCIDGTGCYSTLQEALDQDPRDGSETYIYLSTNESTVLSGGGGFLAAGNYNIVLDLKGKTLDINAPAKGSTGTQSQALHLEKDGKFTLKNGTLTSSASNATVGYPVKMWIQNYATTTLENVKLDATGLLHAGQYVVSNNYGSLTVKGDTEIIAPTGGIAFDLWYGMSSVYDGGVSVSFGEDFTGRVVGNVEYGRSSRVSDSEWQEKAKLTIENGSFDVDFVSSSSASLGDKIEDASIVVSGGTFSDPNVSLETIVSGKALYKIADNRYVVEDAPNLNGINEPRTFVEVGVPTEVNNFDTIPQFVRENSDYATNTSSATFENGMFTAPRVQTYKAYIRPRVYTNDGNGNVVRDTQYDATISVHAYKVDEPVDYIMAKGSEDVIDADAVQVDATYDTYKFSAEKPEMVEIDESTGEFKVLATGQSDIYATIGIKGRNETKEVKVATIYGYDFDSISEEYLIKKGKTINVAVDDAWPATATTSASSVNITNQGNVFSIKGVSAGLAEVDFSARVGEVSKEKTSKIYVYEINGKDVVIRKGERADADTISQMIVKGHDDVSLNLKKFTTEGIASADGIAIVADEAGETEAQYRLSVGADREPHASVALNVHVWNFVTEGLKTDESGYDLGNSKPESDPFKVYDENEDVAEITSEVVSMPQGADETDVQVVATGNNNEYKIVAKDNATPGEYEIKITDKVLGEEKDSRTVKVRVHSLKVTGEKEHYIVTTRNPLNQSANRFDVNVVEENGFVENSNIRSTVQGTPLNGVTSEYRHQGNWRITGNTAGSYTVVFSDGYASATVKVYVMTLSFGQDSYHVKLNADNPYVVINAINEYWHDVNKAAGLKDTYFSIVNDENGGKVTEGFIATKVEEPLPAEGENHMFHWCNNEDCLSAGNYTIWYSADANGGDENGGKTATKSVRLHIYNMVVPDYKTSYAEVGDDIDVNVYDENDRGNVTATIEAVSGEADGLSFARDGFGPWAATNYTRLEANKPGVYMVHYTDKMANGEIVGTYDLRVVVIEVEEETLFVAEGEAIDITGNKDWSASSAVDNTTSEEYIADENGVIKFDTTGMKLGEHQVNVMHDFEEFKEDDSPVASEKVKVVKVMVYKIDSDEKSDPDGVTGDSIKDLLDALNEEGLADDLLESRIGRLAEMTNREDVQALFGPSHREAFNTLRNLRDAIKEGNEISTYVDVRKLTEEEVEDLVDEQLKELVKVMDSEGNVTYYDVNIFIMANKDIVGLMHELNNPITVCLGEVEDPTDGYSRQFTVLRQHAGEAPEVLVEGLREDGGFFIEDGKLYIVSSKFSQYAMFYEDTLNPVPTTPKSPDTGKKVNSHTGAISVNLSTAIIMVISLLALASALLVAKRK